METYLPEVPRLAEFPSFVWHSSLQEDKHDILTVSKMEGPIVSLPKHFLPPTYALEFIARGTIHGEINNRFMELTPNTCIVIFADQVLQSIEISDDCEFYVIGFTSQMAQEINLNVPRANFAQLFMRPTWQMSEEKAKVVVRYFELMRDVIAEGNRKSIVNLVRSLMYYMADEYISVNQHTHQLSRAEDICGRFLSLVESHCREHHEIEWYASELCLAPKYLSNTVKRTLKHTAGYCIDEAIIRHAKSLLGSTTLPIQEISDRLGFQNQSHFGTFIKRHTGMSPKAFREQVM